MAWDIYEGISASGYARAKKYREDQAREKDKKEQEYFAAKAKTHKWDGEKWNKKESVDFFRKFRGVDENYQAMRNPEKAEKEDKRSAREKRMADPKKGINSPAFKEFMRQQGM